MKRQVFDEELTLNCDCNEPRCLIWLGFDNDKKWGQQLYFDFEFFNGGLWKRIKHAMRLVFLGKDMVRAGATLMGFDNIRELRAFCDRCLAHEKEESQDAKE